MEIQNFNQYLRDVELMKSNIPDMRNYPFCIPSVAQLLTLKLHPKVTFIIGENGSGKSTLLEAIAIAYGFNPEGGSKNFNFSTRQTHSGLHEYLRLIKGLRKPKDGFFLRAESFYNVASNIDELDREASFNPPLVDSYGGKSLHNQSHGESFMALLLERFRGNGLYILDEPEAALSPTRQMSFISRMHQLIADGSQFIIATHSPIIMAYPDAQIYDVDQNYAPVEYRETGHYQITREFLNDTDRMLAVLLED